MRTALIFAVTVLLSFGPDAMALPRAPWRRSPLVLLGHALGVLFLCALFMLPSARPVFAAVCTLGLMLLMVAVSNAKLEELCEPFVFSDLFLYVEVFRHPRLYMTFWDKRVAVLEGVGLALLALICWADPPVTPHPWWLCLLGMVVCVVVGYGVLACVPLTHDVMTDQRRYGFFVVYIGYLLQGLYPAMPRRFWSILQIGPFADDDVPAPVGDVLPDVIVIQSESYFDARGVSAAINPSAYAQLDRARRESLAWGRLTVPAWGANTMRTEFAVLTGVAPAALGVARYYPYAFLRRACATLAGLLKRRGDATLTLHPFSADFFHRDRAFPLMHFDRFLDITHFDGAPRVGPYVSDAGLADAIFAELDRAPRGAPSFIFGITMESHGPLRLESVDKGEASQYHTLGEDERWHDLTVYLRHVVNADAMIGTLLDRLRASQRPTVLCFYGDHVPGLHGAFRALGVQPVHSDYFIWRNFGDPPDPSAARRDVPAEALGVMTLAALRNGKVPGEQKMRAST
jgi:hypothetical protein